MTISFYERLTRNPEIGNTPVWVLPNIWTLRRVRNTKFDTNVSNKMLLNAAEGQGCSFSLFWVKLRPTKIRVKIHFLDCWAILKCILKAIILVFFFELRTLEPLYIYLYYFELKIVLSKVLKNWEVYLYNYLETYSKPCQLSKIELFAIVNRWEPL